MSDFHRVKRSYNLAINSTTSSSASQAPNLGSNMLRMVPSVDAWVRVGGTADKTASVFVAAKAAIHLYVSPGETVSAIGDTAAGSLNVTEMTR